MKQYIAARDVVVGDIIAFDTPKQAMTVERLSVATSDGAIGIHCAGETWHGWYPPGNRVPIRARTAGQKLRIALADLIGRIDRGHEYPDAEWAAASRTGVSCEALRRAYDEQHLA